MDAALEHVAGRVPVIVTTSHFGSRICADRSRQAQAAGAAMVMIMPPYHGATVRVTDSGIHEFFRAVSDAIDIPIMIQDAPVSGVTLSAPLLARMATEIENVAYFKIETPGAAAKLREIIRLGGAAIERSLGQVLVFLALPIVQPHAPAIGFVAVDELGMIGDVLSIG